MQPPAAVHSVPAVRFTRSGTVDIAYQLVGEGPLDIVLMIGWVSHLEMLFELPEARHWIERFAGIGRVALFDKRGTGLSDRPSETPTIAQLVPDGLAVMNGEGMEAAAVVGWIDAAALAIEEDDHILFSTIRGRRKTRNMEIDSRVNLLVHSLPIGSEGSTYATISGTV